MRILIATGGTGGHVYPALSLADAARKKDEQTEILFVGNENRMEAETVPNHGYQFIGLKASGLSGNVIKKAQAIIQMGLAYQKAKKIIKDYKPDIAIGFGGYVSAPVMMAAHHYHVKVMLHEQNSILGAANKLCAKFADAIVICYEKCFDELDKNKTRLLGNPRASVVQSNQFNQAYFDTLGLDPKKPLILIVMGSLGSTSVNEAMISALKEMKDDISILYVSGKANYETMKNKFSNKNIKVVDYVDQIAIMKKVDCIICRAGASTAAEITAFGIPSILIPSPYVANNHQYYNAKVLVDKKCAFMIEEKDLNGKLLFEKCSRIMNNAQLRNEMHENALNCSYINACDDILAWIDEMVG